jgi:hypothetical protein
MKDQNKKQPQPLMGSMKFFKELEESGALDSQRTHGKATPVGNTPYRWNERRGKYEYVGDAKHSKEKGRPLHGQETPKNPTGYGVKSSGKRKRCVLGKCQAFASPSGSGLCSHHEQKFTPVGEKVSDALKFKCKDRSCENPAAVGYEGFCKGCAQRRMEAATDLDYVDYELDGLGSVDEL